MTSGRGELQSLAKRQRLHLSALIRHDHGSISRPLQSVEGSSRFPDCQLTMASIQQPPAPPVLNPNFGPTNGFRQYPPPASRRFDFAQQPSSPRTFNEKAHASRVSRIPSTDSSRSVSPASRTSREYQRRPYRRRRYIEYSPSPPRRRSSKSSDLSNKEEKPWFKKKTIWATVASVAAAGALIPATMSARATRASAAATRRSAAATQKSAAAVTKSAAAVTKSAMATMTSAGATKESASATRESARATIRSSKAAERGLEVAMRSANAAEHAARATVNTAVANGHQDHKGEYRGPPRRKGASTASVR